MQAELIKWAELITQLLPEWNHSRVDADSEKQSFIKSVREIAVSEPDKTEQIAKLQQLILETVPDLHIQIINKKQSAGSKPFTEKSNLVWQHKKLKQVLLFTMDNRKEPWMIATERVNGASYGVVAIPSFGGKVNDEHRSAFVDCLMKEKNDKKWSAIIFDFRDNQGGDSTIIKEIAERLSGETVRYADYTEVISYRDKQLSDTHRKILDNKEHTLNMPDFTCQSRAIDRFSGQIYVLQNQKNASATEGAIYMLSQLPNCTTIGIPTKGAFQGGSTVVLPLNEIYDLVIGTEYRERFYQNGADKGTAILEKKGMNPNVYSTDSYFSAVKMIAQNGVFNQEKQKMTVKQFFNFNRKDAYE